MSMGSGGCVGRGWEFDGVRWVGGGDGCWGRLARRWGREEGAGWVVIRGRLGLAEGGVAWVKEGV